MAKVKVTWYGHAAFKVEIDDKEILFDPWFGNPKNPIKDVKIKKCDLICVTHGHGDHGVEEAVEVSKKTGAPIVAIFELANYFKEKGANVIDMNIGGSTTVNGIKVYMTEATHSSPQGVPVGFIVEVEGTTIMHAGDTGLFGTMPMLGELFNIDIAFLPIGDHYTMGPKLAAYACKQLKPKFVIPMHYGTFPVLTGTPEELEKELKKQNVSTKITVLNPGETKEIEL